MSGDATQSGVSEEKELTLEEQREIERKGIELAADTRLNALDAIASKVDEGRVKDDGMELDLGTKEEETEEGKEKTGEEEGQTETTDGLTPEEQEEIEKIKVDGEEIEVPKAKLLDAGRRTYQKEVAADKRLEEATRLKKQAEQLLEEAKKKAALPPTKEGAKAEEDLVRDGEYQTKKKGWIQAIQYGDEGEAEKAFDEMTDYMRRGSTSVTSAEEIKSLVNKSLEEREQTQIQEALDGIRKKFQSSKDEGGFGDLADNPYLMAEVSKLVDEKVSAGADGTKWELYEEAGNAIRQRREEALNPKPKTTHATSLEEKRKKKADLDNVTGVNVRSRSTTDLEAEKTEEQARTEALADIMKARGQK